MASIVYVGAAANCQTPIKTGIVSRNPRIPHIDAPAEEKFRSAIAEFDASKHLLLLDMAGFVDRNPVSGLTSGSPEDREHGPYAFRQT